MENAHWKSHQIEQEGRSLSTPTLSAESSAPLAFTAKLRTRAWQQHYGVQQLPFYMDWSCQNSIKKGLWRECLCVCIHVSLHRSIQPCIGPSICPSQR
jgi:hypothetical protein